MPQDKLQNRQLPPLKLGEPTPLLVRSAEASHFLVPVSMASQNEPSRIREAGTFILKELKNSQDGTLIDTLLQHYQVLRLNHFPVPPTFRVLSRSEGKILVTDLTCGGKFQVLSVNELRTTVKNQKFPVLKNYDEVKSTVNILAQKADNLGYYFLEDVWFLQIDASGVGRVFLGDFGPKGMLLSLDPIKYIAHYRMIKDEIDRLPNGVGLSLHSSQYFLQDVRNLLVR